MRLYIINSEFNHCYNYINFNTYFMFWYHLQELCIHVYYGEIRGPLFLLFQMVFANVEYYLQNYSLFIWMISLSY